MAVIGIMQSLFSIDLTRFLVIPGLQEAADAPILEVRGAAVRAASTATHYIEFSVIMALALPFAIHYGLYGPTSRARRLYWTFTALIASAIPLTVSRTGILCAVVAVLVLAPAWNWRLRYNLLMVGLFFAAAATAARPSLAQTLRGIFSGAGDDPSITGRTERYDMAFYYFWQTPWLGRGTGTWVWPQYQFFDNQWLATLLMNGVVGVAALAALHITAIVLARIAWRRAKSASDRHLAAALLTTQVTAILASGTFDSLSFTTYAVMIAVLAGLCGAIWRLTHPERLVRTAAVSTHDVR
jgi:O-antigen ligase